MKRTTFKELAIALLSLSLIFAFGCSDNNSINQPKDEITQSVTQGDQILAKKHHKNDPSPNDPAPVFDPNASYTASKEIDGKKGGKISLKVSMDESSGTKSEIKLKIPKKAFEGKVEISFVITPGSPVVEFFPHGLVFDKELDLDVKLENFWFGEEDQLDFAYLDYLGNKLEDVEYSSLSFSYNDNFVKVKKAKIKHFSRYGFTR